jgi:hypothetical protein
MEILTTNVTQKGGAKLLSWSQRSSLKAEDRSVGEKSHRGEKGREFPGYETKPIEEGGKK